MKIIRILILKVFKKNCSYRRGKTIQDLAFLQGKDHNSAHMISQCSSCCWHHMFHPIG